MTSQDKDKFICEKLGVCWHKKSHEGKYGIYYCICGNSFMQEMGLEEHIKMKNPDFTSEAGRVQLLKLMAKHKDWFLFDVNYIKFKNYMIDDTGKFRDTVFRWLGGE